MKDEFGKYSSLDQRVNKRTRELLISEVFRFQHVIFEFICISIKISNKSCYFKVIYPFSFSAANTLVTISHF